MIWQAHPIKEDRLKRFQILKMDDPGTGKEVIATGIRREEHAMLMAASPTLYTALKSALPIIGAVLSELKNEKVFAKQEEIDFLQNIYDTSAAAIKLADGEQ